MANIDKIIADLDKVILMLQSARGNLVCRPEIGNFVPLDSAEKILHSIKIDEKVRSDKLLMRSTELEAMKREGFIWDGDCGGADKGSDEKGPCASSAGGERSGGEEMPDVLQQGEETLPQQVLQQVRSDEGQLDLWSGDGHQGE